jgi:uroporphyrinogen-III decarboxylase
MEFFINERNAQNIKKAYKLQKVDKIPVYFSDQLDFLHGFQNIDCDLYHINAEIMLNAQRAFNQRFRGTGILGPNFGVMMEASAFGAQILISKQNPPWVLEMCHDFDELTEFEASLAEPDPRYSGNLPLFYQTYFFMKHLCGDQLAPPMGALASIDIMSLMIGFENLAVAIKLNPEIVHKLLQKVNRFLIRFIEAKAETFNVQKIEMIDLYGDNAGYLSKNDFQEFVLPYNKEIYDYFSNETSVNLYHCDGRVSHFIDLIPEMNCNCLYSFDPTADLKSVVEKIGNRVCLVGNLDPIRLLRNGTPQQVKEKCKELIEIGKKAPGFVLSSGGELANGTPPENIDAVLEAIDEYGSINE